jgi:uncharacterized protein YcnI
LRKIVASAIAGALLMVVPAVAAQGQGAHASVTKEFLTIGGPARLEPKATLRVPIRCSVDCSTTARTKLQLPPGETNVPPSTATGHLVPGKPRNLIVSLNNAAEKTIREFPNASRLRVGVTATDEDTDERVKVVRVFRFTAD